MIATILVDTNVFTGRLRKDRVLEGQYAKHTVGWRVVVAPKTVAEARYGALKASWGQRWLTELSDLIEHVRILPVNLQTVEAVADLRNQCRSIVPRRPMIQPGGSADISPRSLLAHCASPGDTRGSCRRTLAFRLEPLAAPQLMVSTEGRDAGVEGALSAAGSGPTRESPQSRSDCPLRPHFAVS